jgi:alpha-2-macroglobulin
MVACVTAFAVGGCTTPRSQSTAESATASPAPTVASLPAVTALHTGPLPSWIVSISPKGQAPDGSQIRVRFASDLVPVEALESPDRTQLLTHFAVDPPLPGRFIILTPRMVGFQTDAAIPHAARINVRVTAGLKDLAGDVLKDDLAWSFITQPLTLSNLSGSDAASPAPGPLMPTVGVDASDPVDVTSLLAHAHLVDAADPSKTVELQIAPTPTPDPSASPGDASDANGPASSDTSAHYDLVPIANLAMAKKYRFEIDPGVISQSGNLPTTSRYEGRIWTFGPLTFTGVSMSGEPRKRFADGEPVVSFTNSIDQKSAEKAISVSPAANASLPLLRADDRGIVTFDSDALAPRTTYNVRIDASLTDVFGQQLMQDTTASFTTGDLAPDIWAPSGLSIFPSGTNLALDVDTTNLPERAYRAAFRVLKPSDLIMHDPELTDQMQKLLPPESSWPRRPFGQPLNEEVQAALPLHALLGARTGMLAYGIVGRTTPLAEKWDMPSEGNFVGAVGLTNIGIFAQWFPGGGIVRAAHLGDGSPIANASVDIYELPADDGTGSASSDEAPCASGTTAAGGAWSIDSSAFATCASVATDPGNAPALMAVVHDGSDWAYVRTTGYSNGYDYGLENQGWSAGTPAERGTILSDRTLYQPGETAKFLAISYFETNGTIGRGSSSSFDVKAVSPSGAKKPLGTFSPDQFGTFTIPLTVAKNAEVGYWTILAQGSGGEHLDGSYRVAEFKPPNFKVDLTLDSDVAGAGSNVGSQSTSLYLFGAPVEGGTSHVAVTRAQATFQPKGWDAFTFGRQWFYPDETPSVPGDVIQKDLAIDAKGNAALQIPVASDLPYPMQYTVSASTTDVSNLSVADSKTFVALPSDENIGLRSDFLATAGKAFSIAAIVTDPHGKPVTDRRLHLVLQQRIYASVTQIDEGSETPHDSAHYVDVATQDIDAKATPVSVTFTAKKPGEYRVRANFSDAASDVTAADAQLWVAGAAEAAWFAPSDKQLSVKLDKATYRPGDTATALIQSPYPDADLYFSVIRHGVLVTKHERVHGSAPEVSFKITPAMLPNAAVEALLVRRGAALGATPSSSLGHLSRLGFAQFEVALDSKYLDVGITPVHATLEPAVVQTVKLHLSGRDGKPVRGEIAVAVVNDAILQLTGYRFPDMTALVYADEPISTRFGDNRENVKLQSEHRFLDKGFGFGGGAMAGAGSTRVRTKFVPLAYWNARIRTDAAGNASVSFTLPDDLTTWRVMALGLTADARFGNDDATFITTKPLVTNPVLPQFARPGDRFSAGVAVTNVAGGKGNLAIDATAKGGAEFATGSPRSAQTSSPAGSATQAYRFDTLMAGDHDATFQFTSKLGGASDAFAFSVPVVTQDVLESVVTTGTTNATVRVPVNVAESLQGTDGGLQVTVASTLLGDVGQPVAALDSSYLWLGTTAASRIAVASDAILLDKRYGHVASVPALRKRVAADLVVLRSLALADGGFGDWPGDAKSDVYTTAFDVEQLYQAKLAGFPVDDDLAHATHFLGTALGNPDEVVGCSGDAGCIAEARLEVLETLGTLGDARDQFIGDIMARQTNFSYYERVELARFLLRLDDWHGKGIALRDELFKQVNLSARHATVDVRGAFGESDVAGQSQMLSLAVESGTPDEDVDRLLQTLLDQRHNGRWGCPCDDAEAMNALTVYATRDLPTPDFTAVATLPASPPKILQSGFHGFAKTVDSVTLPMDEVARGAQAVKLEKKGTGTLHYIVDLTYRASDSSPGVYQGVRIDRIVRAPGASAPLFSFGLAPQSAVSVSAAQVFDIEDRVVIDHPVDNIVVTDPLPAGFEAIDQSFRTASPADLEGADTMTVDYQSIYKDRVISFVSHLDAGSYAIHYLVRSVTPGTYAWPGASAGLQYAPEEFGRTATTTLTVSEP